ncbi:TetR family transcriptional regulator [Streptosporangium sp. NPDC005286]|uniref:TetR family transcriptional regulator n=1 Tax=Streptosporangium sp. NPDC005286 TaxID=3154463 RepID=UPI00339F25C7
MSGAVRGLEPAPALPLQPGGENYEQLLAVAREAFAEHGTDVSLRDVARRAGVGIGELLALVAGIAWASEQSTGHDLIERLLSLSATGFAADRSPDSAPA